MTMRTVYVLAAIAALLGVFLIVDLRGPSPTDRRAERARLLPGFDRRAVQRITIARAGQAPFSLARQPADKAAPWRLEPGGRRADTAAVDDLLTTIDFADAERTAEVAPATAGLDSPAVLLTLDDHALAIGRTDVSGRGVFVRAGDEIRVGPARLRDLADREASAFRDRRLLPATLDGITAVGWTDPTGRTVALEKSADGRWATSTRAPVANDRVEESLRRLLGVRVERYLSPPSEAPGPRLRLTTRAGALTVTWAGESCGAGLDAVLRTAPDGTDGACLAAGTFDAIWPSLAAAADPDLRLLSQPPEGVTRVELVEGARRLVLEKQRGWRFVTPLVGYQPDPAVITDFLAELHRTSRSPAAAGASGKARQLRIAGRMPESVDVTGPPQAYALLDPDPLRFRDRAALSFAHFDVRRIRRILPGQPAVEATSADGDLWQPQTIDRANATRIATALGNLHAVAFTTKAPPGNPQVTLEVDVQGPGDAKPTKHTLAVFVGCFAQLDRALSFTLASSACDDLRLPIASP